MYNINPSSTCTVQPDSRKKVISVDFFKLRIKGISHYMYIYQYPFTYFIGCLPPFSKNTRDGKEVTSHSEVSFVSLTRPNKTEVSPLKAWEAATNFGYKSRHFSQSERRNWLLIQCDINIHKLF